MTDTLLHLRCICCGLCAEYHLYCLTPPLAQVPPDDWFCPQCAPPQPQRPAEPAAPVHTLQVFPKRERGQGAVPPPPTVFPHAPTAGISPSANQPQHTVTSNGETAASVPGPSQQQQASSSAQQPTQSTGPNNGSSSVAPPLQQQHPVPPPLSVSLLVSMNMWLWYLKSLFVYSYRWLTRLKAMLRRVTSY